MIHDVFAFLMDDFRHHGSLATILVCCTTIMEYIPMLEYIATICYEFICYLTLEHLRGIDNVDCSKLGLCVCDVCHLCFSTPKCCFWVDKKGIHVQSYG